MTIHDRLAELRQRFGGCQIAAFADLSTNMVLASSTADGVTQEDLEILCAEACHVLVSRSSEAICKVFSTSGRNDVWYAVVPGAGHTRFFVRSPSTQDEALCLQFGSKPAEGKDILAASRSLLSEIGVEAC